MKRTVWVAIVLVLGAAIVVALLLTRRPSRQASLRVGVLLPLTGSAAEPGKKALQGVELAIEQYNAQHATAPVSLSVEDSQSDPKSGVSAFNKLVSVDEAAVVIGDMMSSVTLAVAPIAERDHIVLLAPGASSPKVRDAGDFIFRNWVSDDFDGTVMAEYLRERKGASVAAVLYVNNDYGSGLASAFRTRFEALGGKTVLSEGYPQDASDFRSTLTKISTKHPDVLYLPGQPKEDGYIVKQARELGLTCTLAANLSVELPDFRTIAGPAAQGIIYSAPAFDPDSKEAVVRDFVKAFQGKYGDAPDVTAAHGYDAARILLEALARCQFRAERLREALYGIRDFPGVTGRTTFDDHGDVHKDIAIKQTAKDGTGVMVELYRVRS